MVYSEDDFQVVFLDTPGIQMPKNKLGDYMLKISKSTLEEVDVIAFMVDESQEVGKLDKYILEELKGIKTPIILLINKIDKLQEEEIISLIKRYDEMNMFKEIIPISAMNNENINRFIILFTNGTKNPAKMATNPQFIFGIKCID